MKKKFFSAIKHIHFVGIGGIGMSGIAEVLHNQGFTITGSDLNPSENTEYLQKIGIEIKIGHSSENVNGADVVVYSSAVNPDENPETLEAERRGIPVIRRAEMLAEVTRLNYTIAISGTHGKTTTTSMIGLILINAGFDPTVIVGGRLKTFGGTNARLGKGEWTVVEADEYDRSFLQLLPTIAVINNIELEHLDIYKDINDIQNTFTQFANKVPFYGLIVAGIDDPGVKHILGKMQRKTLTFGTSKTADFRAENIQIYERRTTFEVYLNSKFLGNIELKVPGFHNVQNALAAITISSQFGIDFEIIKQSLGEFSGVMRRFEIKGERQKILIVDDYAHHPTEIRATLSAARKGWNRRIIAIFQPHTYSRTQAFLNEFASSFDDSDILIVTDIYPAREKPIQGVTGKLIADSTVEMGHKNVIYEEELDKIPSIVKEIAKENDIIITIGAGNVWKVANKLLEIL
ncbi:MAG: UDP-N-acetylmuramate--L-alanine ligase [Candidatus Kapaibacteriales bacterium]